MRHALIRQHEHGVAGEYGGVGVPTAVYGLVSAAQVGVVHEVVVQQGVVMVSLKRTGGHENAFGVVLEEVVGKEHEYGAYAFAAHRQHILYGYVKRLRLAVVRNVVEKGIHLCQYFFGFQHDVINVRF